MSPTGSADEAVAPAASSGETGSDVYGAMVAGLVTDQETRKTSLEQRALSVITTSGALVTLLFALVATLTTSDDFALPVASHGPLGVALVLFVVAAALAVLTNLPLAYVNVTTAGLKDILDNRWNEPKEKALLRIASTDEKRYKRAKTMNSIKAWLLIAAMTAEVGAVAAVSLAVREILVA